MRLPDRSGLEIIADLRAELPHIKILVVADAAWDWPSSPGQRSIVHLIGAGKRSGDIADDIGCSAATVAFHRMGIRRALGLQSEFALLRYALLVRLSEQESF